MNQDCESCDESHLEGGKKTRVSIFEDDCPDRLNCNSLPTGYSQAVDKVVYTVCSKIKIADDFLSIFIAFIVILRFIVLRGLKYFFQNQKCEDSA